MIKDNNKEHDSNFKFSPLSCCNAVFHRKKKKDK